MGWDRKPVTRAKSLSFLTEGYGGLRITDKNSSWLPLPPPQAFSPNLIPLCFWTMKWTLSVGLGWALAPTNQTKTVSLEIGAGTGQRWEEQLGSGPAHFWVLLEPLWVVVYVHLYVHAAYKHEAHMYLYVYMRCICSHVCVCECGYMFVCCMSIYA